MTTATAEAVTTLPTATVITGSSGGPTQGDTFPFLRITENAPSGYAGCFILPIDNPWGWAINTTHHPALHPYEGSKAWWMRTSQVTINDDAVEVTASTDDRFADVPAEYRSQVPAGARWGTTTTSIDGSGSGHRYLAVAHPTDSRGPLLMVWPGHDRHNMFAANRPGLPDGWRGWWAHSHFEFDPEPVVEPHAVAVGDRVRVTDDGDEPQNNGREATVLQVEPGSSEPYLVRYDNGQPGGEYGWWVNGAEWLSTPEPETPEPETAAPETAGTPEHRPVTAYVPGMLVEVYGWPVSEAMNWNGEAVVDHVGGSYVHVLPTPGPGRPTTVGGFRIENVRPARDIAVGDRVVLATDHVLRPGGPTFSESPSGIGSFAEVVSNTSDDCVRVLWEGGRHSVAHRSCLALAGPAVVTGTPGGPVVGHWFTYADRVYWYRIASIGEDGDLLGIDGRAAKVNGRLDMRELTDRRWSQVSTREGFVIVDPTSDEAPFYIQATVTPAPEPEALPDDVATLQQRLREVQAAYDADLRTIAEVMQSEAQSRDWCSEYEEVARRIDSRINGTFAGERTVTWSTTFTGEVRVPFTTTVSVEVPYGARRTDIERAAREALARDGGLAANSTLGGPNWGTVDTETVRMSDYREQ